MDAKIWGFGKDRDQHNLKMDAKVDAEMMKKRVDEECWKSETHWKTSGEHLGAKMALKSSKRNPKTRQDGQLGAIMGQLGSKRGSQIHWKPMKNRCKNWYIFGMGFCTGFGRYWDQKWIKNECQNRYENDEKRNGRKMYKKWKNL